MIIQPASPAAYRLLHDGIKALAAVEEAGMRVDVDYLEKTIEDTKRRIRKLERRLKKSDEYKMQRKRFGLDAKLTSRDQLAWVYYSELGYKPKTRTATGAAQLDEAALERIGTPYAKDFIKLEKLNKIQSTYLMGVLREEQDGYIHPFYNLHIARTYRSSSSSPNGQNLPIRNPEIAPLIRRAFIPRHKDHHIVEIDISAAEVRVAACYHKDPTMLRYLTDPDSDMHRDTAKDCFMIDEVPKGVRSSVKGDFVFAEFYGSYYKQVAERLWEAIERHGLTTVDGTPMKQHLKQKGIKGRGKCDPNKDTRPGTFEQHIKDVEHHFWKKRFSVYDRWRREWYDEYLKTGGLTMKTGFRVEGFMKRNDVINYPVQGAAFHCLLWSLTQLVRWLTRNKMRSKVVGQIHDSIIADVHKDELDDVLAQAKYLMTEKLVETWDWIVTPMVIEAEVAPRGVSWHEKEEVPL